MKHLNKIALLFLLLSTAGLAQQLKPTFVFSAGDVYRDMIIGLDIGDNGSLVAGGYFKGTVDFDPSSAVYNMTSTINTSSGHHSDAFIFKLDSLNSFEWALKMTGSATSSSSSRIIYHIITSANGDIYADGSYSKDIRFKSTGPLWAGPTAIGTGAPFLAKYSSAGNLIWGYGWTFADLRILDLTSDSFGNVYVVGGFEGSYDFDPLPGSAQVKMRTSVGSRDIFVMKIDASGAIKKVRTMGGASFDIITGIALGSQGDVFLTGIFEGTADLQFGSGISNHTSAGGSDAFILKTDTAFNFKWVKTFGGPGNEVSGKLIIQDSVLYHSGRFSDTADLDPNASVQSFSSKGGFDCFVQKLDTTGGLIWAAAFGGSRTDEIRSIKATSTGNVYLSGSFQDTVDFDPSLVGNYSLSSNGGMDGFVLGLNTSGSFIAVSKFGSHSFQNNAERINRLAINNKDEVYAGGYFRNTTDVDPTLVNQSVTSAGVIDMLLLKLITCKAILTPLTLSACGSYTLPSGKATYTSSGTYMDTLSGTLGCDSVLTINLTILPALNLVVSRSLNGLLASATGSGFTYQWIDCISGQIISGATTAFFVPSTNGSYAVSIDDGVCLDTSACFTLNNIAIDENELQNAVTLYPNPTNGMLSVKSAEQWQRIEVADLLGKNLKSQTEPIAEIDLSKIPSGVYLVKVYFKNGVSVQRIVKR